MDSEKRKTSSLIFPRDIDYYGRINLEIYVCKIKILRT